MTNKLYIDGVLVRTDPDTRIAITYQFYSPLTPTVARFSYSNKFSLPITGNSVIFGMAEKLPSTSQVYKSRLPCRYVEDGVEVIPNGYIVLINPVEGDNRFYCVLYAVDADFYAFVKNRTLNDLDYLDVNQALEPSDVATLRTAAEVAGGAGEIFSAVTNLGRNIIDNAGTLEYIDNYVISANEPNSFVPIHFGYKQILQRIISQAGFGYDFGNLVPPPPPAGAVTFVGVGALSVEFRELFIDIVAPSVSVGDIMIMTVVGKDNITHMGVSSPGWTQLGSQQDNGANLTCSVWYKIAESGDSSATFTFTKASDNNLLLAGVIAAWTGNDQTADVITGCGTPTFKLNASSDTVSYDAFVPNEACHVVAIGIYGDDATVAGVIAGTDPVLTNRFDLETNAGSAASIFGFSGDSTGVTTGARSHSTTSTADAVNIGILFGIKTPSAASPTSKFNSMAVMQAGYSGEYKFQYSPAFRDAVDFSAGVDADEAFTNIGAGGFRVLQFLSTLEPSDFYDPDPPGAGRSKYQVTNTETANGYFTGTFRFTGKVNMTAGSGRIGFYINGVITAQATGIQVLSVGDNNVDIYIDFSNYYLGWKDGDIIQVWWHQQGADPCTMTYYAGGIFSFTCFGGGLEYVYVNQLLPAINQLDYYKDFLFRFGQIPKESNKTIYFKALKEILADQTSLNDWTGKRDKTRRSTEVHLTEYGLGMRNKYRYKSLDSDVSADYGSGFFDLDDENLPTLETYTSIWGSTLDTSTEGIQCARILCQEDDDSGASYYPTFSEDTGNRLLLTRERYTQEPGLRMEFLGAALTDYVVACFARIDATELERSLSYAKVLLEWYTSDGVADTGFLERLKNAKVVTQYYWLTPLDIAKYDQHKMILDEGVQFIFPVIKSFYAGSLTEVQMLKI